MRLPVLFPFVCEQEGPLAPLTQLVQVSLPASALQPPPDDRPNWPSILDHTAEKDTTFRSAKPAEASKASHTYWPFDRGRARAETGIPGRRTAPAGSSMRRYILCEGSLSCMQR